MTTAAATTSASRSRSTSRTFIESGAIVKLDKSLLPNIGNLGASGPTRATTRATTYTVPYMWWTTGVGYDSGPDHARQPTSSKALWDQRWAQHISMLDDFQEVFGMALIQLGYSANTRPRPSSTRRSRCSSSRSRSSATYSTDTIATMTSGDVWIGHIWGADRFAIQETNENVVYYIPEEGGVKGSDTVAVFSGAPHPIAAHLFINHLLDAENSAANTNLIYYMGPNAAAKEFIAPAILDDPTINPDQEIVDKLEELLNLDGALRDEYLKRWQELRRLSASRRTAAGAGRAGRGSPAHRAGRAEPPGAAARDGAGPARGRLARAVLRRPAGDHLHRQPRPSRRARPGRPVEPEPRQLRAGVRPGLPADVPPLDPIRGDHDDPVARDRLPDRLLDLAATAAAARRCC